MRPVAAFLVALPVARVLAQCGPNNDRPYPPGTTTCPAGPGGQPQGGVGGGTSCTSPPCAGSLLGDVGLVTVSGVDSRSGKTFAPGENIYGPFEAGFSSQQDGILAGLGCNPGSLGHVAGGIDTHTAEQMVAHQCSITLPRVQGSDYISLLDECGGHTNEYHFHERLSCLFSTEAASGHSGQVGQGSDGKYLYGKWEVFSTSTLPQLDACGGHFGVVPDSSGATVYHYHVQDSPPFTFGCYGPKETSTGVYKMLTVAECRGLYDGCGNGDTVTVTLPAGSKQYDLWCPCYDADGSNVASNELPVFSGSQSGYTCSGSSCVSHGTTAPSPEPTPTPPSPGPTPTPPSPVVPTPTPPTPPSPGPTPTPPTPPSPTVRPTPTPYVRPSPVPSPTPTPDLDGGASSSAAAGGVLGSSFGAMAAIVGAAFAA